jgi:hypothetical protein
MPVLTTRERRPVREVETGLSVVQRPIHAEPATGACACCRGPLGTSSEAIRTEHGDQLHPHCLGKHLGLWLAGLEYSELLLICGGRIVRVAP